MCLNKVFTQNYYEIKSSLHPDSNYMDLEQKIIFHNNSENKLNHLILYDWNNAYSSNDTPLSKKLYEEYNLALICLLYTSPSPRDTALSRMPSSA